MNESELPDRPSIERALLELFSDGQVHHDDEIVSSLVKRFKLDADGLTFYKNGRTKFGNRIDWVKGDMGEGLRGTKLIRRVGRKRYQILPLGLDTLKALQGKS
jgi:hypothetical protein